MIINISEVFKTIGTPSVTYVERDKGKYEQLLKSNLAVSGKVSLITGPSKTGKSTLYQKVLKDISKQSLIVRCDDQMTSEDVWKRALEEVDFSQVTTTTDIKSFEASYGAKISGKLGWGWLASVLGETNIGGKDTTTENELRAKIISKPSYKHLIPLLKNTSYILVIEDFHYLKEDVKVSLFQQCKAFVDSEISIIILGTAHHAVDLAYSNKDLVGRIAHIEIGTWSNDDLKSIVKQGFEHLNLKCDDYLKSISTESVGMPIITQSICFKLFSNKNILKVNSERSLTVKFTKDDISNAFYDVATSEFNIFNDIYTILITGLRKGSRKYNTYEMLLLIFTIDPIVFRLRRFEIDERLQKLSNKFDMPPTASINSTLGALAKLQKKNDFELLEWSSKSNTLYILEPSFLFYLRWRERRGKVAWTNDDLLKWLKEASLSEIFKSSKVTFKVKRINNAT